MVVFNEWGSGRERGQRKEAQREGGNGGEEGREREAGEEEGGKGDRSGRLL